jgi:DNA-binding transcriptional LysR family regulator
VGDDLRSFDFEFGFMVFDMLILHAAGMPLLVPGVIRALVCFDYMHEMNSWVSEPLDSRQLVAFFRLARIGSFTAAARELHLSQSAVSHSIKALEEAVGCRLFDRLGKKVVLTLAGEQLLHHTEKMFREMSLAKQSLARLGKWGLGRLRIGASPTACQYIVPAVLREFKKSFPEYQIGIQPGDTPVVVEALQQNRIDLALSLEPQRTDGLEVQRLFEDELHFIIAPQHPWAASRRVDREDIPRQNYILYERASRTFQLVDEYFRAERMVLNTVMELGSMEAIKELVKLGLGISILAPWIAQDEIREGSLVALPVGRRKLSRRWAVVYARGKRLGLAEETFIGICRSVTENLPKESDAALDNCRKPPGRAPRVNG